MTRVDRTEAAFTLILLAIILVSIAVGLFDVVKWFAEFGR